MERKLEYINQGRGGYVVYKDGKNDIKLFFEYGGGNCVAIIYVRPSTSGQAKQTDQSQNDKQS
jgi:hypothetical protein